MGGVRARDQPKKTLIQSLLPDDGSAKRVTRSIRQPVAKSIPGKLQQQRWRHGHLFFLIQCKCRFTFTLIHVQFSKNGPATKDEAEDPGTATGAEPRVAAEAVASRYGGPGAIWPG